MSLGSKLFSFVFFITPSYLVKKLLFERGMGIGVGLAAELLLLLFFLILMLFFIKFLEAFRKF